jgi:hypothetical protein
VSQRVGRHPREQNTPSTKEKAAFYTLALEMLKAATRAPVATARSSASMMTEMEATAQLKARISVPARSRVWIRAWAIPWRSPK